MNKKIMLILGFFLLLLAFLPFVKAGPEAIFQWEENRVERGEATYIEFYQNFKQPYNFTIISDLVEECWVINDYYDENKVVCRSDAGLCKSLELLDYQYIRCKTWDICEQDSGKKAILFYEYENDWGRQQGIYQTQELNVPKWTGKIVATGPFMIAVIASIAVILIILAIIYFAGSSLASWFREWGRDTNSYEELQNVKKQIGKKGEIFSNCIVIY